MNKSIYEAVQETCEKADRNPVSILAISKNQPMEKILPLLEAGHRWFGENRVQEAMGKWLGLHGKYPDLRLHLTGPLQTNKVKMALELFNVIETVDRPRLVLALSEAWDQGSRRTDKILIQVNSGRETQKSGVWEENLPALIALCHTHKLPLTGLMCVPPLTEDPAAYFQRLADLAHAYGLSDLSMGMSHDYPIAIAHGATWVRLGKAFWPST